MTLFYIAVGVAFVLAMIVFMGSLCPSCGLELVSSPLDRLGEPDRMDHCRHCGWRRRR